jgi:hypothetical protein
MPMPRGWAICMACRFQLVKVCEQVFEGLPLPDAKAFFAAIPEAVGRDGKDLKRVHWAFLAAELRALPEVARRSSGCD